MAALTVVPTPNERRDGKPLRSLTRHERRRAAFIKRVARSVRPLDKFAAAADYFRGVATDPSLDHPVIERAVAQATEALVAAADQLAATRRVR